MVVIRFIALISAALAAVSAQSAGSGNVCVFLDEKCEAAIPISPKCLEVEFGECKAIERVIVNIYFKVNQDPNSKEITVQRYTDNTCGTELKEYIPSPHNQPDKCIGPVASFMGFHAYVKVSVVTPPVTSSMTIMPTTAGSKTISSASVSTSSEMISSASVSTTKSIIDPTVIPDIYYTTVCPFIKSDTCNVVPEVHGYCTIVKVGECTRVSKWIANFGYTMTSYNPKTKVFSLKYYKDMLCTKLDPKGSDYPIDGQAGKCLGRVLSETRVPVYLKFSEARKHKTTTVVPTTSTTITVEPTITTWITPTVSPTTVTTTTTAPCVEYYADVCEYTKNCDKHVGYCHKVNIGYCMPIMLGYKTTYVIVSYDKYGKKVTFQRYLDRHCRYMDKDYTPAPTGIAGQCIGPVGEKYKHDIYVKIFVKNTYPTTTCTTEPTIKPTSSIEPTTYTTSTWCPTSTKTITDCTKTKTDCATTKYKVTTTSVTETKTVTKDPTTTKCPPVTKTVSITKYRTTETVTKTVYK